MSNRIEKTLTLRALVLAGFVMGSVTSAALAAAPGHVTSKSAPQLAARLNGAYGYAPGRTDTGIETSGPIYSRGYYVGQDPDPSIRLQLLRDAWYGSR